MAKAEKIRREKAELANELKEVFGEKTGEFKKQNFHLESLKQKYRTKKEVQGGTSLPEKVAHLQRVKQSMDDLQRIRDWSQLKSVENPHDRGFRNNRACRCKRSHVVKE